MLVKIGKYTGFCVCRRSYLLCSPILILIAVVIFVSYAHTDPLDHFLEQAGGKSCKLTLRRHPDRDTRERLLLQDTRARAGSMTILVYACLVYFRSGRKPKDHLVSTSMSKGSLYFRTECASSTTNITSSCELYLVQRRGIYTALF